MADTAMILGIVGTVTGVVALAISIKSYVRVGEMKALDLRLELEKAFNNLEVALSGMNGYLDFVHQSHMRVLAAKKEIQSGRTELFEKEFANDKVQLRILLGTQPRRDAYYGQYSPIELEKALISVHAFHVQISAMRGKYQSIFDTDEVLRKEVRESIAVDSQHLR